MVVNNLGYIFECRYDGSGNVGVMESYKVVYRGNTQNVTITCAIDNTGKIIVPANLNQSLGFRPLNVSCPDVESLDTFLKSNKPVFGKLGEFAMLASGTLVYDKDTGELLSHDKMSFYVPKTISENVEGMVDNKGNQVPALICEKVSTSKGLNTFSISEQIYSAYAETFLSCLSKDILSDKRTYMHHLVLKEN